MDAADLARWTRFAAKGGIGKCTAVRDCVAESPDDLMFLKGDEVIVLMQLPSPEKTYLGYCEGVVGHFTGADVQFHSKLKKPVLTKSSTSSPPPTGTRRSSRPISSQHIPIRASSSSPGFTKAHTPIMQFEDEIASPRRSAVSSPISLPLSPTIESLARSSAIQTPPLNSNSRSPSTFNVPHHSRTFSDLRRADSESPQTTSNLQEEPEKDIPLFLTPMRSESPEELQSLEQRLSVQTASLGVPPLSPNAPANFEEHDISSTSTASSMAPVTPAQLACFSQDGEPLHVRTADFTNEKRDRLLEESDSDADVVLMERNFKRYGGEIPSYEIPSSGSKDLRPQADKSLLLPSRTFAEDDTPPSSAGLEPPSPAGFVFGRGMVERRQVEEDKQPEVERESGARESVVDERVEEESNADRSGTDLSRDEDDSEDEDEDGGFGIGWNLLKGLGGDVEDTTLEDGDEDNEDEESEERDQVLGGGYGVNSGADAVARIPEPDRSTSPSPLPVPRRPLATHSISTISSASRSVYSDSEAAGGYYEDLDIYDDYRYSRYSKGSTELLSVGGRSRSDSAADSVHVARARSSMDSLSQQRDFQPEARPPPLPLPLSESTRALAPIVIPSAPRSPLFASELRSRIEAEAGRNSPDASSPLVESPRSDLTSPSLPLSPLSPVLPLTINKRPKSPSPLVAANPLPQVSLPPSVPSIPSTSLPQPSFSSSIDTPAPASSIAPITIAPVTPPTKPTALPSSVAFPFPPHPATKLLSAGAPQPLQSPPRKPAIHGALPTMPSSQTSLQAALRQAGSPKLPPHLATIIGRTESDLLSSPTPVPIAFVVKGQEALLPPLIPAPPRSPILSLHSPIRPVFIPPHTPDMDRGIKFPPQSLPAPAPIAMVSGDVRGSDSPIPRNPQFFPRVGQPRPRSQSFSGFSDFKPPPPRRDEIAPQSPLGSPLQLQSNTPPSEPASPTPIIPAISTQSTSPSASSPLAIQAPVSSPPDTLGRRIVAKPSPLFIANPSSPEPLPPASSLRVVPSTTSPLTPNSAPLDTLIIPPPRRSLRHIASHNIMRPTETDRAPSPSTSSLPVSPSPSPSPRPPSTTPSSPMTRTTSLRSKLSSSTFKSKATASPAFEHEEETVQVQDMEFELIKPIRSRTIDEEERDNDSLAPPKDNADHRSLSPLGSRGGHSSFDSVPPSIIPSTEVKNPSSPHNQSIEAHRARELRWISTMNAGGGKSKKIRKLVLEDVPPSVRGVVWLYLTDSKARRMDGVYAKLVNRGRVTASDEIEKDVQRCFPDDEHLRDSQGPLVSVLQAYLSMFPDLRYERGLALIAGNILLQSPEEDAFWTLVCMMDNHIRGYFSPSAMLMDVDAALFAKAVQAADPQLANWLFVHLNVHPIDLCRPWFLSLFCGVLPHDHLLRLWDVFLFEGPTFLFRLGLSVLFVSRPFLMDTSRNLSSSEALAYLIRPPPSIFPPDPNTFIANCFSTRFKEDDLRKLRPKIEAQMKQQRAAASR